MEEEIVETLSDRVEKVLEEKGIKKTWLAEQFGITFPGLHRKLKENYWTNADKALLKQLLNVE